MSYRNPARLIDTQTIQHYKDMMNNKRYINTGRYDFFTERGWNGKHYKK